MRSYLTIFIFLSVEVVFSQQNPAIIAGSLQYDLFRKSTILGSLAYLCWSNPTYLSDDQYAVGILTNITELQERGNIYTDMLTKCDISRIKPFLNSYYDSNFRTDFDSLYHWSLRNKDGILKDFDFSENREFVQLVNKINVEKAQLLKALGEWANMQTFLVLPDGSSIPDSDSFTVKYYNPICKIHEEVSVENGTIVKFKQIEQFPVRGNSTWTYNENGSSKKVYCMFDGIISCDTMIKTNGLGISVSYLFQNKRQSFSGSEISCWHPNGNLSYKSIGLIDDTTFDPASITEAFAPNGMISYKNGTGTIYVYLEYSSYRELNIVQLIVENRICKAIRYYNSSGKLEVETIKKEGFEYKNFYNFKTGKLTKTDNPNKPATFPKNFLKKDELAFEVDMKLTHGLLPYGCVYPIASPRYTAPILLNQEEIKAAIIKNIDRHIDFASGEFHNEYTFVVVIPSKDYDQTPDSKLQYLIDMMQIQQGTFNSVAINSGYDIFVRIKIR